MRMFSELQIQMSFFHNEIFWIMQYESVFWIANFKSHFQIVEYQSHSQFAQSKSRCWDMKGFHQNSMMLNVVPAGWLERQPLALLSPPENRTSLIKESLTWKDKGRLDGHLHSDAQVSIRAKKHQVYKVISVLETVYLTRVLGTLYIGWN